MRLIAYLRWLYYTLTGQEAVRLTLYMHREPSSPMPFGADESFRWIVKQVIWRCSMAKIGDKFVASIAPTNAAGKPAPVTGVFFEELSDLYDVESVSADGLSATFVAVKSGSGATVTVTAKSKSGATLTDAKALPDVDEPPVDEEATALNLTVA